MKKGQQMMEAQKEKLRAAAIARYALPNSRARERQSEIMRARWRDPLLRLHEKRAARVGTLAPGWQGGEVKKRGYVWLYAPDHPAGQRHKDHYVKRSRLVVEKRLGRYLEAWEHVHHINGIRDDDRSANLVVLTKADHRRLHGPPPRPRPDQVTRGEQNGSAKLTAEKVRQVRQRHEAGEATRSLARAYGVTPPAIRGIIRGITWRHVV